MRWVYDSPVYKAHGQGEWRAQTLQSALREIGMDVNIIVHANKIWSYVPIPHAETGFDRRALALIYLKTVPDADLMMCFDHRLMCYKHGVDCDGVSVTEIIRNPFVTCGRPT